MSDDYPPPPPGSEPDPNQPPAGQPGYGQPGYGQPGYGQPGYGQVPYGQPPQHGQPPSYPPVPPGAPGGYGQQKTSPLAITSLVLGIIGIPCCSLFVLGIAAVVTGFLGRKQIAESNGLLKGEGMALTGLALGVLSIVLAVVVWVLNLTGAVDSNFSFDTNA